MDFLTTLARTVDPESPARDNEGDEGDGIMDMMLKPALHTYESQDAKKGNDGGGDEPDDD